MRNKGVFLRVVAVVLAAGKSERMGRNKLALMLDGKSIIEHVLDALEETSVSRVIVVLGNRPEQLRKILKSRSSRIDIIVNKKYAEGMISSFRFGLQRVEGEIGRAHV
jgi:molybdenum cofactor cytidylyltransferase